MNDFQVMGVLNVTPDSFSDGGQFDDLSQAMVQVDKMVRESVDWIDVGGESTRPGAASIAVDEELERVLPIIKAIKTKYPEQRKEKAREKRWRTNQTQRKKYKDEKQNKNRDKS